MEGEDLGLDERLRVDEWGALMLGQEHHFRDLLHPNKGSFSLRCTSFSSASTRDAAGRGADVLGFPQYRDHICGAIFCCTSELTVNPYLQYRADCLWS